MEKFGFTADAVAEHARRLLDERSAEEGTR